MRYLIYINILTIFYSVQSAVVSMTKPMAAFQGSNSKVEANGDDSDDIIYIIRTDYIISHSTFKAANSEFAYQSAQVYDTKLSSLKDRLSDSIMAKLAEKPILRNKIIVAEQINNRVQSYIRHKVTELGYTISDIEPLYVPNTNPIDQNLIKELDPKQFEQLEKFLNDVLDENILNKFKLIQTTTKASIVGAIPLLKSVLPTALTPYQLTISKNFVFLNQYLHLCQLYATFLLNPETTIENQLEFLQPLAKDINSFNKKLVSQSLPQIAVQLLTHVNRKIVLLKVKLIKDPCLENKLSDLQKKLMTLSTNLSSLNSRSEQLLKTT